MFATIAQYTFSFHFIAAILNLLKGTFTSLILLTIGATANLRKSMVKRLWT